MPSHQVKKGEKGHQERVKYWVECGAYHIIQKGKEINLYPGSDTK